MNIAKSLHPGLLYKTFTLAGKNVFVASLLWAFRLDSGEPVLEQKLWATVGDMMGKNEMFDMGMPKANGEMLAHGSFFSPSGKPVLGGKVSITIGKVKKELAVFGNRRWIKAMGMSLNIEGPEPAVEIPVSWTNAFGGEKFAPNPIGKGLEPIEVDGETIHPLPNVEYPDRIIGAPHDRPRPAGFGRIDVTWEPRSKKAGTYDDKYIKERMPGYPDDTVPEFFNDATPDQWVPGYFQGDEAFRIENMNPDKPVISGRLPGVNGRCFVNLQTGDQVEFKEIRTRLDTVWFFPAANMGVLIHRGTVQVAEDDGADVLQILVAHENIGDEPRSLDHYRAEMKLRVDPETAGFALLNTAPIIPEGVTCAFKQMMEQSDHPVEGLAADNILAFADEKVKDAKEKMEVQKAEAAESMRAAGMDPDEHLGALDNPQQEKLPEVDRYMDILEKGIPGIVSDPDNMDLSKLKLEELNRIQEETDRLVAEKRAEAEAQLRQQLEELKTIENPTPEVMDAVARIEKSLDDPELQPIPRVNEAEIMASVQKQFQDLEAQAQVLLASGISADQVNGMLDFDREDVERKLADALAGARDAYRQGAHAIEKAESPHPGREEEIAAALVEAYKNGGPTAWGDYAFVDLSGLDLSGIDLSGAYLEFAILKGTRLAGAKLEKAIITRADLTDADLTGADLRGANLGGSLIENTELADADLTGAILSQARIIRARFHQCQLTDRPDMFFETYFEEADFSHSNLAKSIFIGMDISGCVFEGADFSDSHFMNPVMRGTVFDRARLSSVNFIGAQAENASFKNAIMKNVRFMAGSVLAKADFSEASATEANFMGCDLREADFSAADISSSNFMESDLTGARLKGALAVRTQFIKANLDRAVLNRINLMEGSLMKAKLTKAQFLAANLYSVSFIGARLGETQLDGAYLEKTILKDWRP